MNTMSDSMIQELIEIARPLLGEIVLSRPDMSAATVACAIRSASGRTYTGVCVHLCCGIGFCAEHAAVAEMLKSRETAIRRIVAIDDEGVLAPCGRCRELIVQLDRRNLECEVMLPGDTSMRMADLLPRAWLEPLFARD